MRDEYKKTIDTHHFLHYNRKQFRAQKTRPTDHFFFRNALEKCMTVENHTKYEILKNKQSANCLFFLLSYEQRR